MRALIGTALVGIALTQCPAVRADDYPARPVTVVSPYAAGGGIDLLARLLASRLEQRLGRPFVIENKAGAATAIAATSVAHAPPDGHTILLATSTTMAINVSMAKHLAYDPARELAPIALVTQSPFVLVVNPELPVRSVAELIAYAKAHPGELNYRSAGIGSFHHLSAEMLSRLAGIRMTRIPYKATPPALNDVVAGRVHLMFGDVTSTLPLVASVPIPKFASIRRGLWANFGIEKYTSNSMILVPLLNPKFATVPAAKSCELRVRGTSGKLRALGVSTAQRVASAPDIAPLAEAGVPGFDSSSWQMFVAPAATPPAIVALLNHSLHDILEEPAIGAELGRRGLIPIATDPPEKLQQFVKDEIVRWGDLVRQAGAAGIE